MPKIIKEDSIIGDVLFKWNISEYEENNRPKSWLVFMLVLAFALVIYSVFTNNFLFSLIIILFSIIVFLQSIQRPIKIPFIITNLGIVINDRFYRYSELREFYIIYNPEEKIKMLFIETQGLSPRIRVPLMDQNPLEVRKELEKFLEENLEKEEEPLTDYIARKWKLH